jgi:hypothetical protein
MTNEFQEKRHKACRRIPCRHRILFPLMNSKKNATQLAAAINFNAACFII